METTKVRVKYSQGQTEEVFPVGFETVYYKTFTEEDKTSEGWWTKIHGENHFVDPVTTPKGTFKDIVFIGKNGGEYSSDWFYKRTGKIISEFFEKLKS